MTDMKYRIGQFYILKFFVGLNPTHAPRVAQRLQPFRLSGHLEERANNAEKFR